MTKSKLPIKILDIEGDGFHLLTEVFINDVLCVLLIDTGASKSVLDSNRINKFVPASEFEENEQLSTGLGTNSMTSHSTIIDKIKMGDIEVGHYKVVIIDLSHVNESYDKLELTPIDGVLGSDLLLKYNAVIDYGKKQLILKNN
jgi:hypothetical protein